MSVCACSIAYSSLRINSLQLFVRVLVFSPGSARLPVFKLHWESCSRLTVKFSVVLESCGSQAFARNCVLGVLWIPSIQFLQVGGHPKTCGLGSRSQPLCYRVKSLLLACDHGLFFPLSAWEGIVDLKAGADPRSTGNRLRKGDCRGSNWIHHLARGYQPYTL